MVSTSWKPSRSAPRTSSSTGALLLPFAPAAPPRFFMDASLFSALNVHPRTLLPFSSFCWESSAGCQCPRECGLAQPLPVTEEAAVAGAVGTLPPRMCMSELPASVNLLLDVHRGVKLGDGIEVSDLLTT